MRLSYHDINTATDEVIYENFEKLLSFWIGDVRKYDSIFPAVKEVDIVIHAAAMKQVPTCEYFPYEATLTNIAGAKNLVRAICENDLPVEMAVAISTDKACKPINVMGMTKAIMERIFTEANLYGGTNCRFFCVRYGNVIASRGSVIPLFLGQIAQGGPVTITMKEMTRFFLSLERAVETVVDAIEEALPGEIFIPKIPAVKVVDLANALINGRDIPVEICGIRPGEKVHEILVSEEERYRTVERGNYYVIRPMLPEISGEPIDVPILDEEYSSRFTNCYEEKLKEILADYIS